jgi:outer membrane protein assembly factor BamB
MRALIAALIVVQTAGVANASPFGPKWTQAVKCPGPTDAPLLAAKDELLWTDGTKLVRRARATGAELPAIKVDAKMVPYAARDGLVLLYSPKQLAVVELATGKTLWKKKLASTRAAMLGGRVAFLTGGKQPVLEVVDAKTGAKQASFAATDKAKHRIASWALGDTLVFVAEQRQNLAELQVVTAYRLADGKPAWTYKPAGKGLGGSTSAAGDEALIDDDGLVWMDAKGATVAKLPLKHWYLGEGATTAERLYVLTDIGNNLAALDRKTRKVLWTVPTNHSAYDSLVHVGATAIYARTDDEVFERDPKTGAPLGKLGVADARIVGGPADATPAVITCDRKQLVAYDPSGRDVPLEDATISGTVACSGCEADKQLVVTIAGEKAKPDAKGAFTIKVKARGSFLPNVAYADEEAMGGMYWISGPKVKPLVLTGAGTYKVKLVVEGQMQDGE